MTADLNKGISNIQYNLLNLPKTLTISNSLGQATNTYVYSADCRKLSVSKGTFKTDYVGNMIYESGTFKRILVEGGYYENGAYHFYIQDHLGNNRIVANQNGTVEQSTQYYPFGMAFADGITTSNQPYKYNGKELDGDRGLNWYDYEARQMEPALGRFTTMDPLAEKYYSVSPYAYCANNPMKYIDPDGKDIKIKFEENGKTYSWKFNGSNQDQAPKNQFVSDFITAYNHNVKNGGGDNLKTAATTTDYTLNIKKTEDGSYFGTTSNGPRTEGTVFWNPSEGLETPFGTLSPATALEHEMDHGVHWQTKTEEHIRDQKSVDSHFETMEEKRVITGSEYKTGVANGELKPIPKGKENKSSSYRGHKSSSGVTRVTTISPISNKKKQ